MQANPWRGEVDLVLDGINYIMRPTFAALSAIERELGCGLVALARKLGAGAMSVEELAVIVTHTLITPLEEIKEALIRNGLADSYCAVADMLGHVFEGFDDE